SLADKPTYRPGGAFLVLKEPIKSNGSANTLGASQGDDRDHMSTSFMGPAFHGSSSSFLHGQSGGSAQNIASGLGESSGSFIEEETQERRVVESRTEEIRTVRRIRRTKSRNQGPKTQAPMAIEETVWLRTESGQRSASSTRTTGPPAQAICAAPVTDQESVFSKTMMSGPSRTVSESQSTLRQTAEEHTETEHVSERALSTSYASSQFSFGEVASADQMRLIEGATPAPEDASSVASARPSTVSVGEIGAFSDRADSAAAKALSSTSSMYSLPAEEHDLNAIAPWKPAAIDLSMRKESCGFQSKASDDKEGSEKSFPAVSAESIEVSDYKTIYGKSQSEERQVKDELGTIDETPTAVSTHEESVRPAEVSDQDEGLLCATHAAQEARRKSSSGLRGEIPTLAVPGATDTQVIEYEAGLVSPSGTNAESRTVAEPDSGTGRSVIAETTSRVDTLSDAQVSRTAEDMLLQPAAHAASSEVTLEKTPTEQSSTMPIQPKYIAVLETKTVEETLSFEQRTLRSSEAEKAEKSQASGEIACEIILQPAETMKTGSEKEIGTSAGSSLVQEDRGAERPEAGVSQGDGSGTAPSVPEAEKQRSTEETTAEPGYKLAFLPVKREEAEQKSEGATESEEVPYLEVESPASSDSGAHETANVPLPDASDKGDGQGEGGRDEVLEKTVAPETLSERSNRSEGERSSKDASKESLKQQQSTDAPVTSETKQESALIEYKDKTAASSLDSAILEASKRPSPSGSLTGVFAGLFESDATGTASYEKTEFGTEKKLLSQTKTDFGDEASDIKPDAQVTASSYEQSEAVRPQKPGTEPTKKPKRSSDSGSGKVPSSESLTLQAKTEPQETSVSSVGGVPRRVPSSEAIVAVEEVASKGDLVERKSSREKVAPEKSAILPREGDLLAEETLKGALTEVSGPQSMVAAQESSMGVPTKMAVETTPQVLLAADKSEESTESVRERERSGSCWQCQVETAQLDAQRTLLSHRASLSLEIDKQAEAFHATERQVVPTDESYIAPDRMIIASPEGELVDVAGHLVEVSRKASNVSLGSTKSAPRQDQSETKAESEVSAVQVVDVDTHVVEATRRASNVSVGSAKSAPKSDQIEEKADTETSPLQVVDVDAHVVEVTRKESDISVRSAKSAPERDQGEITAETEAGPLQVADDSHVVETARKESDISVRSAKSAPERDQGETTAETEAGALQVADVDSHVVEAARKGSDTSVGSVKPASERDQIEEKAETNVLPEEPPIKALGDILETYSPAPEPVLDEPASKPVEVFTYPEWVSRRLGEGKSSSVFSSDAEMQSGSSIVPTIGSNGFSPPPRDVHSDSGESISTAYGHTASQGAGSIIVSETTYTAEGTAATGTPAPSAVSMGSLSGTAGTSACLPTATVTIEMSSAEGPYKAASSVSSSDALEKSTFMSAAQIVPKTTDNVASDSSLAQGGATESISSHRTDTLPVVPVQGADVPPQEKAKGSKPRYVLHKTRIFATTPTQSVELVEETVTQASEQTDDATASKDHSVEPKPSAGVTTKVVEITAQSSSELPEKLATTSQPPEKKAPLKKESSKMGGDEEESSLKESDTQTPPLKDRGTKRKLTRSHRRAASKPPLLQRTRIYAEGLSHSVELISEKSYIKDIDNAANTSFLRINTPGQESAGRLSFLSKLPALKDVLDISSVSEEDDNAINATPKLDVPRKMEKISKKISELNFKRALLQEASGTEKNPKRFDKMKKMLEALNRTESALQRNLSTLAHKNASFAIFGTRSEEVFSATNRDDTIRESEPIQNWLSSDVFRDKMDTLPTTVNTLKSGNVYEDTVTSSHETLRVRTTALGHGQFQQQIDVAPEKKSLKYHLTGPLGDRAKFQGTADAPTGSGTTEIQKVGEASSDSEASRAIKDVPERKTVSEPNFSISKQPNLDIETDSAGSGAAGHGHEPSQKAGKETAIKEETSFTDKETFRMPNDPEASSERSSTHIKVTDSVASSEGPKEKTVVTENNARSQSSFPGITNCMTSMPVQTPWTSLSQVLSQHPLKVVKRRVVLETVTKTVTEKKESVKSVTDKNTGVEHKDSHLESTTKEEVQSKREEETIESYDSAATVVPQGAVSNPVITPMVEEKQGTNVSSPVLVSSPKSVDASTPKESVASQSAPDIKGVKEQTCQTPEKLKRAKQPVAIRVHDETLADDEEIESRKGDHTPSDHEPKSILKPLNRPAAPPTQEAQDKKHKLEFQEAERPANAPPPLVQPPAPAKKEEDDAEEEEMLPPPSRFKFNRKDSIAVTKLRMLKQTEDLTEDEDDEKGSESFLASSAAADDKSGTLHPMFKPPVVINIEEPQPADTADMASTGNEEGQTSQTVIATQPFFEVTTSQAKEGSTKDITECGKRNPVETPSEAKIRLPTDSRDAATDEKKGVTESTFTNTNSYRATALEVTESSLSGSKKAVPKAKASFTDIPSDQKEFGQAEANLDGNQTQNISAGKGEPSGSAAHNENKETVETESNAPSSRPMELLPASSDGSQAKNPTPVTNGKAIMEACVNKSVKEVKNVENSVVTSETEEVFYFPKEKVTKKHISETRVLTEKRSYTEILIEPNISASSLMPAIPEEIDLQPVRAALSGEMFTRSLDSGTGAAVKDRVPASQAKESVSTEGRETEGFRAAASVGETHSKEKAPVDIQSGLAFQGHVALKDSNSHVTWKSSMQTSMDFTPYEAERLLPTQSTGIQEKTKPAVLVGDHTAVEIPSSDFDTCKPLSDGTPEKPSFSRSGTKDDDALSGPTELLSTAMDDMAVSGLETTRDIDSSTRRPHDSSNVPVRQELKETITASSSDLASQAKELTIDGSFAPSGTEFEKPWRTIESEKGSAQVDEDAFKSYGQIAVPEVITSAVLDVQSAEAVLMQADRAAHEASSGLHELKLAEGTPQAVRGDQPLSESASQSLLTMPTSTSDTPTSAQPFEIAMGEESRKVQVMAAESALVDAVKDIASTTKASCLPLDTAGHKSDATEPTSAARQTDVQSLSEAGKTPAIGTHDSMVVASDGGSQNALASVISSGTMTTYESAADLLVERKDSLAVEVIYDSDKKPALVSGGFHAEPSRTEPSETTKQTSITEKEQQLDKRSLPELKPEYEEGHTVGHSVPRALSLDRLDASYGIPAHTTGYVSETIPAVCPGTAQEEDSSERYFSSSSRESAALFIGQEKKGVKKSSEISDKVNVPDSEEKTKVMEAETIETSLVPFSGSKVSPLTESASAAAKEVVAETSSVKPESLTAEPTFRDTTSTDYGATASATTQAHKTVPAADGRVPSTATAESAHQSSAVTSVSVIDGQIVRTGSFQDVSEGALLFEGTAKSSPGVTTTTEESLTNETTYKRRSDVIPVEETAVSKELVSSESAITRKAEERSEERRIVEITSASSLTLRPVSLVGQESTDVHELKSTAEFVLSSASSQVTPTTESVTTVGHLATAASRESPVTSTAASGVAQQSTAGHSKDGHDWPTSLPTESTAKITITESTLASSKTPVANSEASPTLSTNSYALSKDGNADRMLVARQISWITEATSPTDKTVSTSTDARPEMVEKDAVSTESAGISDTKAETSSSLRLQTA
ncbi:hypothetical protein V5799_018306, partial [Amblyomma americanum]